MCGIYTVESSFQGFVEDGLDALSVKFTRASPCMCAFAKATSKPFSRLSGIGGIEVIYRYSIYLFFRVYTDLSLYWWYTG